MLRAIKLKSVLQNIVDDLLLPFLRPIAGYEKCKNSCVVKFKTFSDYLVHHPQLSSPFSFNSLSVCLSASVSRAFPQSGPDPAQIGFEAISVPTRSICSKLLSISFHETTMRGLREERKKKNTQTAQKNKPDTNMAGLSLSLTCRQRERDVSSCSEESPL